MNDEQALQQIDAAMRALFANFVNRAKAERPGDLDKITAVAHSIASGENSLIYQVEVLPIGISLNAGIAPGGDMAKLARIFDGIIGEIIPAPNSPLWN